MTQRFAAKTEGSAEKSRMEIERTLIRYGADQFGYGWQEGGAMLRFRAKKRQVAFVLPMPDRNEKRFTHYRHSSGSWQMRKAHAADAQYEQAIRQRWRALTLIIKA
jgi:hypothetical protein